MTDSSEVALTRKQIRQKLRRHEGSMARLAKELGVSSASVSIVLNGRGNSKRIYDAAEALAREYMKRAAEKRQRIKTRENEAAESPAAA